MKIGYARVSTDEQNLDMQLDALTQAGCTQVFQEKESGGKDDRPVLKEALAFLRVGDTLVVYSADRFARSGQFFTKTVDALAQRGIWFASLTEPFLATGDDDPLKEFFRSIIGAVNQLNLRIIRARIRDGKAAARVRGRQGGRPKHKVLSNPKALEMVMTTYASQKYSVAEICAMFGIASPNTFYLYRKQWVDQQEARGTAA